MKILTEFNPSLDEMEFLEKKLFQFNCHEIKNYSYENFMLKSVDGSNAIIAGIHGQIGGNWLYIASLWVNEEYRSQGTGKKLLMMAENIAVKKNCFGAYLYTYRFQNPEFYKKLGYHVFGTLENFGDNNSKMYMKKILKSQIKGEE